MKLLRISVAGLGAAVFSVFGSCADGTNTTNIASTKPPCCQEMKPGAVYTDRSLYQLDSEWTSDVGRKIKLGVFEGRPQVVALFFTHCEYACPIIVNDLRRIEAALPQKLRDRVDFLLVSIDHERDTPEVLHVYRESRKLPVAHWSLLHGGAEDVRELAALLGVNYRKDARGQYAHSNTITLLNARGEIVRQLNGLNQDIAPFVQTIEKTLKD
jgi:protein SCO1/2